MNNIYVFVEEHCVICGTVIPESCQVCPNCENRMQQMSRPAAIKAPTLAARIGYLFAKDPYKKK